MRGLAMALCGCTFAAVPAFAARSAAPAPMAFSGEWVGSRNGETVVWVVDDDGRLRVDGRGASYAVHGDTITVAFDPPSNADAGAPPETAVYCFTPDDTATRLFVYGFDLGKQGVLLFRTPPTETAGAVEDAAPPVPPAAPVPAAAPRRPVAPGPPALPLPPPPAVPPQRP